ncbi:MAG TPA: Rv3654c family TadE-like protein [Pseudonocardia sp.]|jgi:secretion/DNA translocation related TadE-like protein|uniref:Rv3654c family TadE-like protein n=1 Tax=Pseudonocardia sp. TaxID=60912 RepID=UPI002F41AE6D
MALRDRAATGEQDDGLATVWAVSAIAVLVMAMVFGLGLGAAATGRHRAEAAADLAALAGAGHALDGEPTACAYADRVAEPMHARLVSCRLVGAEVTVVLEVPTQAPLLAHRAAVGRARAGPAEPALDSVEAGSAGTG